MLCHIRPISNLTSDTLSKSGGATARHLFTAVTINERSETSPVRRTCRSACC